MTSENLDNLPAGPELDALVAERVMGWHLESGGEGRWLDGDTPTIWRLDSPAFRGDWEPWAPSTDIAAAWEVMEKIKEKIAVIAPYVGGWQVMLLEGEEPDDSVCAPTMPLAICRAALKVVYK